MDKQPIPIHLITGFLGSGKTTLLTRALDYYKLKGMKPAVLMNELGEVNLDGMLVDEQVPMSELLGGCICCTIRGDVSAELKTLVDEYEPDVIFVESTGAANPLEMVDGVTDASMLTRVRLASVVTVVDAGQLYERSQRTKDKTYRLMQEQIRCGTYLILNKSDVVDAGQLAGLEQRIREWNRTAPVVPTVRSEIDLSVFDRLGGEPYEPAGCDEPKACGCGVSHSHTHTHSHEHHHPSHNHVMAYTHYFDAPVDSRQFEDLVRHLPGDIYRAKGILYFTDTIDPFLFQYAYKEADFMKVTPQRTMPNVAVFIGEHFDQAWLVERLNRLSDGLPPERS